MFIFKEYKNIYISEFYLNFIIQLLSVDLRNFARKLSHFALYYYLLEALCLLTTNDENSNLSQVTPEQSYIRLTNLLRTRKTLIINKEF